MIIFLGSRVSYFTVNLCAQKLNKAQTKRANDPVPKEDEIVEAVKKLRRNRWGEASGMRVEHLKGWLVASNRGKLAEEKEEEKTDAEEEGGDLWGKLVELTQTALQEGEMVKEATW